MRDKGKAWRKAKGPFPLIPYITDDLGSNCQIRLVLGSAAAALVGYQEKSSRCSEVALVLAPCPAPEVRLHPLARLSERISLPLLTQRCTSSSTKLRSRHNLSSHKKTSCNVTLLRLSLPLSHKRSPIHNNSSSNSNRMALDRAPRPAKKVTSRSL